MNIIRAISLGAIAMVLSGCASGFVAVSSGGGNNQPPPTAAPNARTCTDVQALTSDIQAAQKLPGANGLHAWVIDTNGVTNDLQNQGLLASNSGNAAITLMNDIVQAESGGHTNLARIQQDATQLADICSAK
jgi:hypothetical protein